MKKVALYLVFPMLFLVLSSCGEDDPKKGESLVSKYKINSAILANDVTTTVEGANMTAGTNITPAIVKAFFDEIECLDNSGKGLELTEDNKIFYLCLFEDYQLEKGSWSINEDRSQLQLSLAIADRIVPLILTDLKETGSSISGRITSIPVPPAILSYVDGDFLKVQDIAVLISIDLTIDKVD